jgi:hypothetical protein
MAHLPFLFCDDEFSTTEFSTTEFVTTEFVTTESVTTVFVTTNGQDCCRMRRSGAQLPETAIGRSDGKGIIARCDDERNDL